MDGENMASRLYAPRTRAMGRANSTVKKTFTLSPQAVSYLAQRHRETGQPTSQIIEELLGEKKLQAEQARVSAAITGYYDSLDNEEVQEECAWGQFAESEMEQ